jgi:hypothetical protein
VEQELIVRLGFLSTAVDRIGDRPDMSLLIHINSSNASMTMFYVVDREKKKKKA